MLHLRWSQCLYFIWYRWLKPKPDHHRTKIKYKGLSLNVKPIGSLLYPIYTKCFAGRGVTIFNRTLETKTCPDWSYMGYGKLWNYHLQYAEFLLDDDLEFTWKQVLLEDLSKQIVSGKLVLEPYPVSLRIVHSLEFLAQFKQENPVIQDALRIQIQYLEGHLEKHLSGNHLLENYLALVYGHLAFEGSPKLDFYLNKLLIELDEQLLNDGAHYELCLSYHAGIFCRLSGLIFLLRQTNVRLQAANRIELHARNMYAWLKTITLDFTVFPLINDSMSWPNFQWQALCNYAKIMKLDIHDLPLADCGYRWMQSGSLSLMMRVGEIPSKHQPGHAHADYLTIYLYHSGKPVLVDTGVSTYEADAVRLDQRSSSSHNVVVTEGESQSEIWSAFRMGRRARIMEFNSKPGNIEAKVLWYQGHMHHRKVSCSPHEILIIDQWKAKVKGHKPVALFHFNHSVEIEDIPKDAREFRVEQLHFSFEGLEQIEVLEYHQCFAIGEKLAAKCIRVYFCDQLKTRIQRLP